MAVPPETVESVADVLGRITSAWREGRPEDMTDLLDEHVVMALPGFTGRLEGRRALIDSFESFKREARVHGYQQGEIQVDGTQGAAVAQFPFEVVYERNRELWRSTGWDVWVFARRGREWVAVWRTMQAVAEERVTREGPAA